MDWLCVRATELCVCMCTGDQSGKIQCLLYTVDKYMKHVAARRCIAQNHTKLLQNGAKLRKKKCY